LAARLPRDLDTICLKCLAKEPARRYSSADALADDLRRFLDGEPILARRIGVAGQTWRWCRRKPLVASLLAALVVVCGAGMAGVTWQWRRAEGLAVAAQIERDEVDRQRGDAVRERNRAIAEQDRAEAHYRRAREVLDRLTQLGVELSARPGMTDTARDILEKSLTFYEGFLQERSEDPIVRLETSRACHRAALINQQLGRMDAAEPILRRGITIIEGLIEQQPQNLDARKSLADCLVNLAFVQRVRGDATASLATYERTASVLAGLRAADPTRRAYTVALGNTWVNQSIVLRTLGRSDDALQSLRRAIDIVEPLLEADPNHRTIRTELSLALDDYGGMLWARGNRDEGERYCRRGFDLRKSLVRGDIRKNSAPFLQQVSNDPAPAHLLARSHHRLARISAARRRTSEALDHYQRALDIGAQVATRWPKNSGYWRDALGYAHDVVRFQKSLGDRSSAEKTFALLLVLEYQYARGNPKDAALQHAAAKNLLMSPFFKLHHPIRAAELARRAVALAPDNADYRAVLALAHLRLFDLRAAVREIAASMQLRMGWTAWVINPAAGPSPQRSAKR
jgi:tetratricopeptide (TPR) repeat protein